MVAIAQGTFHSRQLAKEFRCAGQRLDLSKHFSPRLKALSPSRRFVIALHSPDRVPGTGLRVPLSEKSRWIHAPRSQAVRSLQDEVLRNTGISCVFRGNRRGSFSAI